MLTILAQAAHEGEGVVEQTQELLTNPAHWIFEIISDIVVGAVLSVPAYFLGRWQVRKHDRKEHPMI
jgi:cytochrome oxidase assembly protein ShyY1